MEVEVFLLLGSNLGNRKSYLSEAADQINKRAGQIELRSSYYETASWGKTDQPNFLNQAIVLKTDLTPEKLLFTILDIEKNLGRERVEKWGSRTIDIDILFFADRIIRESNLIVPHPYVHERAFALLPLAEIAPDLVHPVLKKTIMELSKSLRDSLPVNKIDAD